MTTLRWGIVACAAASVAVMQPLALQRDGATGLVSTSVVLSPTDHPVLSRHATDLWLAPDAARDVPASRPIAEFAAAMDLADDESYDKALPLLQAPSVRQGVLRDYAIYYAALAELRLGRPAEARVALQQLQQHPLVGHLSELAALAEAECAVALHDYAGAASLYERVTAGKPADVNDVLMRLGTAAKTAGDFDKARDAFGRVYFDAPASELAALAEQEYDALPNVEVITPGSPRVARELARAERLYGQGAYPEARAAFQKIGRSAPPADRDLVRLRLAQIDYHTGRARQSRPVLQSISQTGPRPGEALYFYARASRNAGDHPAYIQSIRRVVERFPGEPWAEEALNSLATHYILVNDDDAADGVFRELYAKYPRSVHAARAAWRAGWRAYRQKRFGETVAFFDHAAADFPRSDYRPSWLYWAGRAYEQLGQEDRATERFMLTAADYLNSYYGRLAMQRLDGQRPVPRVVSDTPGVSPQPRPNDPIVRALIEARRYDDAIGELRFAERMWGESPSLRATIAWIQRRQGQDRVGQEQFDLLRGSITTMRRAYPQFMASGGELLPREVLTHIFPLSYWDLIQKYAKERNLEPFLVAALMAQESTFVPAIRSSAGAVGLMQLMPGTARPLARKLGLTYSSRLLTDPEANIRMGTTYLADKIAEFGELHLALASYNAGENPVRRWKAERPNVPQDEFIDDIPYPETQNYVKRILGTVEDYRRLYGQ
ncbi:MAG: transglycosylase SLT domain-containing protein [Vicinamibacterales bacterium]